MPQEEKKGILHKYIYVIKALVTLSLCIFILLKLDWETVKQTVFEANYLLLFAVTVCMFLNIVFCAFKWQFLLLMQRIRIGLYQLSKYYFTAMFFSNFLPSIIGGDAYRIYKIYKLEGSKSGAIIPVFMERFVGIVALLAVGLVGAVVSYFNIGDRISLLACLLSAGGLLCIIAVVFFARLQRVKRFFNEHEKVPEKIKIALERLASYDFKDSKMVFIFMLSVFYYLFLVGYRLLLIYAFGEDCSVFNLAMIIMLSTLAASLPISLNGVGLLEGSFVFLISQFGVNFESAVMVMLMQRFIGTTLSLLGGVAYYFDKQDLTKVRSAETDWQPDTKDSVGRVK